MRTTELSLTVTSKILEGLNSLQHLNYKIQRSRNKFGMTLFIFLFLFLFLPKPASAHMLKTDKEIGAILHVDPEDDPIAGEQSNFFFALKDKQNNFSTTNCDCIITITQNGKTLTQQITKPDPQNKTTIIFSYTFPQKDIYEITLTGKPTTKNAFQPFELTYDVRVAREKNQQNTRQPMPLLMLLIGGIMGSILLIIFWKR